MRVARLDLIRYGHFTNRSLEFPKAERDLHFIYGPNEAGKSTALQGLEDLLFGIPKSSSLDFLHSYKDMRLGALLQHKDTALEFRRRKGNVKTILTTEETEFPQGETDLNRLLGGADLEFFTRMFFLNHARLTEGGEEMLNAKDDAGQALFAATAGLKDLREYLLALDGQATELFTSRRSQARAFYQAEDRLNKADAQRREFSVSSGEWQKRKEALENAQSEFDEISRKVEQAETESRRMNRIARVYPYVRKKESLESEVRDIGQVVLLPEDAEATLNESERNVAEESTRIQTISGLIKDAKESLNDYKFDSTLIEHAADIQRLADERIRIRASRNDLPKRIAELETNEAHLREISSEIGWPEESIDDLIGRIPGRPKVAPVRELTISKGSIDTAVESANVSVEEAKEALFALQDRLNGLPEAKDTSALSAILKASAEQSDIATRIQAVIDKKLLAERQVQSLLKSLTPPISSEEVVIDFNPPPLLTLQTFRDRIRDAESLCEETRRKITQLEGSLGRDEESRVMMTRDSELVPPEEIKRLRARRDAGWSLVRRRYIEAGEVSDEEIFDCFGEQADLSSSFENSIQEADKAADMRFSRAEEAAQLGVLDTQIQEKRLDLRRARAESSRAADELKNVLAEWQSLWKSAPFELRSPDVMLDWHKRRSDLVEAVNSRNAVLVEIAGLESLERRAASEILKGIKDLGADTTRLTGQRVRIIQEAARSLESDIAIQVEARRRTASDVREAQGQLSLKTNVLTKAQAAAEQWRLDWEQSLKGLGLDVTTRPVSVEAQLDSVEALRELSIKIKSLREDRITKIEHDISVYEHDVRALGSSIASGLGELIPDDAVLRLVSLHQEASKLRDLHKSKEEQIAEQTALLEKHKKEHQDAQGRIDALLTIAKVTTIDQLRSAITTAKRYAKCNDELSEAIETLDKHGDGLSVDELSEHCKDVDLDAVSARVNVLAEELKDLRDRAAEARDTLTTERQAFESLGGSDAAIRAESDRQSALAEIEGIAEEYVRLRSAALLLRWGIDRYQTEKATPMLERAGELFRALTCDSFSELGLDFDDEDRIHMIGIRGDGSTKTINGMSSGARDQLYLALRIAAVEDYQRKGHSIPLVADDLFINFDNERAEAGFRVLSDLSNTTQVLFFTHHPHLLEIAKSALHEEPSVLTL